MVTGAIAFGGTGAAAAGLFAQPSMQSIYVNGQPVYCTAYAISGNNYVRLRDIGQAVGFDVSYDAATDSVQIPYRRTTGGTAHRRGASDCRSSVPAHG